MPIYRNTFKQPIRGSAFKPPIFSAVGEPGESGGEPITYFNRLLENGDIRLLEDGDFRLLEP